jgi:hypothetical protein
MEVANTLAYLYTAKNIPMKSFMVEAPDVQADYGKTKITMKKVL